MRHPFLILIPVLDALPLMAAASAPVLAPV
jgi:hypothetical protein